MRPPSLTPPRRSAFTLVEILIVVVILGILASIVIPQFSNATHTTRENTLKDSLRYLRTQVSVYKAQHEDTFPGENGDFVTQLTTYTDIHGASSATGDPVTYRFGPYLTSMPDNMLGGKSTIHLADASTAPLSLVAGTHGWIYKPTTGELIADQPGSDADGKAYAGY